MKLQKPRIISHTNLITSDSSVLSDEAHLAHTTLSGVDATNAKATAMHLESMHVERCIFTAAWLERLSAEDVIWRACDMSAARCSESSLFRMHFKGGRMPGIDLSRSTLRDVCFEDCKLDMANFRFARLQRVEFRNCQMLETDFQAAHLVDVTFPGSTLEKVVFDHAKITRVDARNARLHDIRGWQSLAGLKIDQAQLVAVAPQLALSMGLVVEP